ncbi:MAG: hypothetical protein JNK54_01980 [Elusimicrobia bacterium]|jgi:hypothetical protein|nr:hypothetical protein [Elusimicrobiota bacterium]
MLNVGGNRQRCYLYQMRSGLGDDPYEILTRLTHRVWQTFDKRQGDYSLDPHLWPEIFHTFHRVFQGRLSFNPYCGQRDACYQIPCVLCGREPHAHAPLKRLFHLETRRPLPEFLQAIAAALERRLRRKDIRSRGGEKPLRDLFHESMVDALKEHFFMSEVCSHCPVRETLGDRRVWVRDVMEVPWGGLRRVLPQEAPQFEELEEA